MNRELRDKWVAALRSGEYKQIRGRMYGGPNECMTCYCCLGVASKIVGFDPFKEIENYRKLIYLNDGINGERAHSFGEIADWIEENL